MKEKLNKNGQFAVHDTQRLNKKQKLKKTTAEAKLARELKDLAKQNIRTVMQALHGCRKNCAQCRQEEEEWEPKIIQKEVKHV